MLARPRRRSSARFLLLCGRRLAQGRGEIDPGEFRDRLAELLAQHLEPHLLDRALVELAELKGPERDPDEAGHLESEMTQDPLDLAILAFGERH